MQEMNEKKLIIDPKDIDPKKLPPISKLTEAQKKELIGTIIETPKGKYEIKEVTTTEYEGEAIKDIQAVRVADENTLHLGENANVENDANEQQYLETMYTLYIDEVINNDLRKKQKAMGKYQGPLYDENSSFEDFCRDALSTSETRKRMLRVQIDQNKIDNRTYTNSKLILEFAEATLKRFLEGSIKF